MIIEEHFDECPYTGKLCRNAWDCAHCEIETEERLWAEETEENGNDAEHD